MYTLAVDLGTTYTAAAVLDETGTPSMVGLGNRAMQIPSVLYADRSGELLVGEAAERRAAQDPTRIIREFKRRIGDHVPAIVGGVPYSPAQLIAGILRWVVRQTTERHGSPAADVVLTHPANWGQFKVDILHQAAILASIDTFNTCPEPVAAAMRYATQNRMDTGERVCVYDLGGGTFDVCVVEKTAGGFAVLGRPGGIERLGGIDFDEAIFQRVITGLAANGASTDDIPTTAIYRLRRECVDAKEALSFDVEAVVGGNLATGPIRLTRAEFENMIRPTLRETTAATGNALRSAGVDRADLTAIVLVGGSSRIPLVTEMLTEAIRVPITLDTHPKHDVALGATLAGGKLAGVNMAGVNVAGVNVAGVNVVGVNVVGANTVSTTSVGATSIGAPVIDEAAASQSVGAPSVGGLSVGEHKPSGTSPADPDVRRRPAKISRRRRVVAFATVLTSAMAASATFYAISEAGGTDAVTAESSSGATSMQITSGAPARTTVPGNTVPAEPPALTAPSAGSNPNTDQLEFLGASALGTPLSTATPEVDPPATLDDLTVAWLGALCRGAAEINSFAVRPGSTFPSISAAQQAYVRSYQQKAEAAASTADLLVQTTPPSLAGGRVDAGASVTGMRQLASILGSAAQQVQTLTPATMDDLLSSLSAVESRTENTSWNRTDLGKLSADELTYIAKMPGCEGIGG